MTDGRTDGSNFQVSIAREHADALQIGCCVTYKPHVVEFMLVYANLGPQYKLPTMQACHCQPTFSVSHAIGHTALDSRALPCPQKTQVQAISKPIYLYQIQICFSCSNRVMDRVSGRPFPIRRWLLDCRCDFSVMLFIRRDTDTVAEL